MTINPKNWISNEFGEGFKINESILSDGSCFFDSLAVAFQHHRIDGTIADFRKIVKDNVTPDNFYLYKELYNNALIGEDYQMIRETRFIKSLDTYEDFKDFIMTNKFWADMLAISIIEKLLKIKIILFDEDKYDEENDPNDAINCGGNTDKYTVVKCSICGVSTTMSDKIKAGNLPDSEIIPLLNKHGIEINEKTDVRNEYNKLTTNDAHNFVEVKINSGIKPDSFVLMNYENGNHYQLVYYKEKAIFKKLSELPKKARDTIVKKCGKINAYSAFL
jgi:hypothetical protein